MKLKKYIVSNLSEAILKIKRDLGDEAVIISTRKVQKKDLWWKPVQQKVEVTAVVDLKGDTDIDQLMGQTAMSSPMRLISRIAEEKITPIVRELDKIRNEFFKINPASGKVKNLQNHLPTKPVVKQEESLQGELVMSLVSDLLWHRVDENHVSEIADVMTGFNFNNREELKEKLAEYFLDNLCPPIQFSTVALQSKVHVILGQQGVGKSSVIIKLATQQVLQGGKKVAFITYGKNRKTGDGLLHKYAPILKAPCAIVKNEAQYLKQIQRFESSDLIFVEYDLDDLATMDHFEIPGLAKSHISYVAQMGDPSSKTDMWLSDFVDSYIVTHLDATSQFGDLLNISLKSQKPFLAFTAGSQIPEDYEEASLERIIDCLLNFSGNHPVLPDISSGNETDSNEGIYQ